MKFNTTVEAIQLSNGDKTFAGQVVKYNNGEAFAVVTINGAAATIKESEWLVTNKDGSQRILSAEAFKSEIGGISTEEKIQEQKTALVVKKDGLK